MIAVEIGWVLGPAPCVGNATHLVAIENRIDGAWLEVGFGSEAIWPVVNTLLLVTGYDAVEMSMAYARLPQCEKSVIGPDLACTFTRTLARSNPDVG